MKKQLLYFSILFSIVLLGFNSCTIKKRLYEPGYHVEWNKTIKETKPNQKDVTFASENIVDEEKIVSVNQEDIIVEYNQTEITQEFEQVYASNDENTNYNEIINSKQQKITFTTNMEASESGVSASVKKEKKIKPSELTKGSKKIHRVAILGLVLSILSVVFFAYFMWLGFFCSIAGFIISKIVLNKIKSNPEKYTKTRKIALIGLIISSITAICKILLFSFVMLILLNMHVE
jgi:uncharacterized membrane protein